MRYIEKDSARVEEESILFVKSGISLLCHALWLRKEDLAISTPLQWDQKIDIDGISENVIKFAMQKGFI